MSAGDLLSPFEGITFHCAYECLQFGVPNTSCTQAADFIGMVSRECDRSEVFREFFALVASECKDCPIDIKFGKNSCGFVDSFRDMTMDSDDFLFLPCDPPSNGHGLAQGEIMLHILEERMMMAGDVAKYNEAHLRCFSANSFQNRYRLEMGFHHTTAIFDVEDLADDGSTCNFYCCDRGGNITRIRDLPVGKCSDPAAFRDLSPSTDNMTFSTHDFVALSLSNLTEFKDSCRDQALRFGKVEDKPKLKLLHWAGLHAEATKSPVDSAKFHALGPIVVGLALRKAWSSLFTLWRMARTDTAAHKLLKLANARQILLEVVTKELAGELDVISNDWAKCDVDAQLAAEVEAKRTATLRTMTRQLLALGVADAPVLPPARIHSI